MVLNLEIPEGLVSVYDFVILSKDDFVYLGTQAESWWCSLVATPSELSPKLLELCAGVGGMGVGASFLGAVPFVSVDHNSLACSHLETNQHGHVLCIDLLDGRSAKLIHKAFGESPGTVNFGFPCQPHSSQGWQRGNMDQRFEVFEKGLQVIFLSHAQTALLECVPAAGTNADVEKGTKALARVVGWDILALQLDLHQQWPCRRSRWFALLLPSTWNTYGLRPWPSSSPYQRVGDIFRSWGRWNDEDETSLQLYDFELQAYMNAEYGSDKRLLEFTDIANTFLHSYGNAMLACPCGCRHGPFCLHSLRTKGLRGCFVQSLVHHNPRFLHPKELGLLLGMPNSVVYPSNPRAALSLLGLIASPLQVAWIYAHLRINHAKAMDFDPLPSPLEWLRAFQHELLRQSHGLFQTSEHVPQQLHLVDPEGHDLWIVCPTSCTVAQLLQAQCISLDWNEAGGIAMDGQRLSLNTILDKMSGPYALTRDGGLSDRPHPPSQFAIGIRHMGIFHTVFLSAGQFLFEALRMLDINLVNFLVDFQGKIYGADFRVWKPLNLVTVLPESWPPASTFSASCCWAP
eukprot:s259_g37.t1